MNSTYAKTLEAIAGLLKDLGYFRYFQMSYTSKTGHCWDLPTHLSCPIQSGICISCYGDRGHYRGEGPERLRLNNWLRLHTEGFDNWVEWMAIQLSELFWGQKGGIFRFHSTGDVFSWDYWLAICRVVRLYPTVSFWLPTHNYLLMRRAVREGGIPHNLSVGLSQIWKSSHGRKATSAYHYIRREQPDARIFRCYVFRELKQLPSGVWVCPSSGTRGHKKTHSCHEAKCYHCFDGSQDVAFRCH